LKRTLALSIGSLAMGLVVLRGAVNGEMADRVAFEAIGALIVFLGIGAVAGSIADYLVRDAVEHLYRKRVQWYREGLEAMTPQETADEKDSGTVA